MNCERCGKDGAVEIGTTASGTWFKCDACGHAFIVPSQRAVNERIVTEAATQFLRSA